MKLLLAAILLVVLVETNSQRLHRLTEVARFPVQAAQGAADMGRAYLDMRRANWKNSDKYFHARGNYDAARRGPGGRWAAKVISDGREWVQLKTGRDTPRGSAADQMANRWGRSGGNPNVFRPRGLPRKY